MNQVMRDTDFIEWWLDLNSRFFGRSTAEEIFSQIDGEVNSLGFEGFAYGCRRPVPFNQGTNTQISGSYPGEWLDRYNQNDYAAVDPSIIEARRVGLAIWTEQQSLGESRVFREARDWNLNIGATFMMRGRDQSLHVIGVARQYEAISEREALVLKLKLRCIAELLEEQLEPLCAPSLSGICLSEREEEVLRWIADGKCSKGIAEILNISENTINFHVKSIQRKFGSSNRVLAAAYAAALGII